MNNSNLKPFNTIAESEQREIAKMGAKRSAEVRREKKELKEVVKILLDTEPGEKEKKELLERYKLDPGEITTRLMLLDRQLQKALKGDLKSCEFICEIANELPKEEIEHEVKLPIFNIEVVDNSEVQKEFEKLMNEISEN